MSWLTREQMNTMGFAAVGENVFLSDKASYYNCANIRIGCHVRVDDFCVLSAGKGGIVLGDFIHVAVYTSLIGQGRIELADFSNLSSRVAVYSSNDDYSGAALTNPMVPEIYSNVIQTDVLVGKHVIVGSGSVILPGVTLHEGSVIGALSLVNADCERFSVYAGIPAKRIKARKTDLLELEKRLRAATA